MKVSNLTTALKLISKISNPSSLTSLYRSVEIRENSIRAISEFGNIQINLDEPTGLTSSLLDTQAVLTVFNTLPQNEEITLHEKANHVAWEVGGDEKSKAKGKLNYVVTDHTVPEILIENTTGWWQPPADFGPALHLAGTACQAAAVSFGLYGITIQPVDDKIHMMSSNTIALAATKVDKGNFPDKTVTVRPPVPGIIYIILAWCNNQADINICDEGIIISSAKLRAHLPLGVNLDHDLKETADKFQKQEKVLPIDASQVKKFLARARNLTEKQVSFTVSLKLEKGKLVLEHRGIASSSEQWFLAEGADPTINYSTVSLSADLLMIPLESTEKFICDYLDERIGPDGKPEERQLILRGSQPDFLYVVSGNQ